MKEIVLHGGGRPSLGALSQMEPAGGILDLPVGRMPPRKAPKTASAAAAVGGRDDISNLPDGALQHMLSFLPAQDAVRTCVLAKRWRHMWKSTTGLRFVWSGMKKSRSAQEIQEFVDHLLRQALTRCTRGGSPLHTCEFDLVGIDEDDMGRIFLWIRIALQCKVWVLRLFCWYYRPTICPDDDHPIFISQYLKKLELNGLDSRIMPSRFLDFCYCPVLEDLKIVDCYLSHALLISSKSLKRLTIDCGSYRDECRMPICAPNLVSLWLEVEYGKTPSLHRMPSLITAYVKINSYADRDSSKFDDDDTAKSDDDDDRNKSIFLHSLSEVRDLSLKSPYETFIFRRDLKFCSSFNNLKSLLLDEYWCCEPADFSDLACLLKLCPVLEKLTLELYSQEPKYKVETKLNCNPLELSSGVSRYLKIVEVKSQVRDERINNILTFLNKQIFHGRKGSA